ncbi:MAG: endolytic transglycosylase MltG, partial [Clostridia bacterium]|nr:endolytic transglycosylase MltG [Clostridia bacterium]
EKEAFLPEHRPMISSVLHNRLNAGMMFQCDPTVKYCTGVIQLIYPEKIDHYKYYYNTYRCKGLMAGPICNPGMDSINAVINPADTDYLYFIIGTVEPYEAKYSETYDEHQKFWIENKDRLTGKV